MKGKEMKKFGLLRNEGFDSFEFEETEHLQSNSTK